VGNFSDEEIGGLVILRLAVYDLRDLATFIAARERYPARCVNKLIAAKPESRPDAAELRAAMAKSHGVLPVHTGVENEFTTPTRQRAVVGKATVAAKRKTEDAEEMSATPKNQRQRSWEDRDNR
jgi:hypothetical protein